MADPALRWLEREIRRKADWFDPEDVAAWKKMERRKHRDRVLDRLLGKERRCPRCGEQKIGPRQWVKQRGKDRIICRSCFQKLTPKSAGFMVPSFARMVKYYVFDVEIFLQARVDSGLTMKEFARRAGWSYTYQRKIEHGDVKKIDEAKLCTMIQVFHEQGGECVDVSLLGTNESLASVPLQGEDNGHGITSPAASSTPASTG